MASVMDKIKNDTVPALVSGGIGLLAYNVIFGESIMDSLPFFGSSLPAFAIIGGGIFTSSLIGEVLQNEVLTRLPQSQAWAQTEGMLVKPVLSGASLYGLFKLGVSENTDFLRTFGLGAGATIGGSYASKILIGQYR